MPLGEVAEVCGAATVSEAYEIAPFVRSSGGRVPPGYSRFIVSGNIRPGCSTWSEAPVRYLKASYEKPIVRLADLPATRAAQAQTSKIVLSGMARRPTAFVDGAGEYLAGKSTVLVLSPKRGLSLTLIASILNSRLGALIYKAMFMGLELGGGYLRFGPPQLKMFPVPKSCLTQEAAACKEALDESEVYRAFGVDDGVVAAVYHAHFAEEGASGESGEASEELEP